MPCYCGCATRQSRWIWSLFALFAIGGLCFHVPSYVKTVNCGKAYDACIQDQFELGNLTKSEVERYRFAKGAYSADWEFHNTGLIWVERCHNDLHSCMMPDAIVEYLLSILLWVAASAALCVLCCCNPRPRVQRWQVELPQKPEMRPTGMVFYQPLPALSEKDSLVKGYPAVATKPSVSGGMTAALLGSGPAPLAETDPLMNEPSSMV